MVEGEGCKRLMKEGWFVVEKFTDYIFADVDRAFKAAALCRAPSAVATLVGREQGREQGQEVHVCGRSSMWEHVRACGKARPVRPRRPVRSRTTVSEAATRSQEHLPASRAPAYDSGIALTGPVL